MPDERPNFLILMSDQQRGDGLSCAGHPVLMTPNIDGIAQQGTRFARAYSTCPSCIPARRSFMSGQFPATHGLVGCFDTIAWEPAATMPGELKRAGYETILIGRNMHQHPPYRRYGFNHMIVQDGRAPYLDAHDHQAVRQALNRSAAADYGPGAVYAHGADFDGWTARPWHLDESLHPTTWTVSQTLRWLDKRDPSCPFFCVASFIAPHPPLVPPAFYFDRYMRQDLPEPAIGDWASPPPQRGMGLRIGTDQVDLRGEALRSCRAGYYGMINHLDDQIARIFHFLRPDVRDNTVVIYLSDHGEMLGDHFLFRKCYPFEGAARVPLLISAPAHFGLRAGHVDDHPVCLEDVMPTVLEMAGVDIPDSVEGQSLVPLLRGEKDADWRPYLHGEHAVCYRKEQANHYLTDGRLKYVWMTERGEEMLFDLQHDPMELHNLAADEPWADEVDVWRQRLIERLASREEGFTDGYRLIPGRPYPPVMSHAGK